MNPEASLKIMKIAYYDYCGTQTCASCIFQHELCDTLVEILESLEENAE